MTNVDVPCQVLKNGMHVKALSPLVPRNSLHMQKSREPQSKPSPTASTAHSDRKYSVAQRESVPPAQHASNVHPLTGASKSQLLTVDATTPGDWDRMTSAGGDRAGSSSATQPPDLRATSAMLTAATLVAAPVLDRYQVVRDLSAGGRTKVRPSAALCRPPISAVGGATQPPARQAAILRTAWLARESAGRTAPLRRRRGQVFLAIDSECKVFKRQVRAVGGPGARGGADCAHACPRPCPQRPHGRMSRRRSRSTRPQFASQPPLVRQPQCG
jgi:hypothetical protein